jgi:hypothetical protein
MLLSRRFLVVLAPLVSLGLACGSSEESASSPSTEAGGSAGRAGGAGATAGASAAQAGAAGSPAGSGGAAGSTGGAAGVGGSSGAGAGGATAGAAGAAGDCAIDTDCATPATIPVGCVRAVCAPTVHQCVLEAVDQDGDGFPTASCKGANGEKITLGNDCDDTDAAIHPGGWDGPEDGAKASACDDGIDQDCSGVADDGKAANGATCVCAPGDVASCREDSSGKPLNFPGAPAAPVGECKLGSKTCLAAGAWGPCTGAVAPAAESCNGKDDDCDGAVDNGPPADAVYWVYDGDDDLHGATGPGFEPVLGCIATPPTAPPAGCTSRPLPCALGDTVEACCPAGHWKLSKAITANDCEDQNHGVNPDEKEVCGDNLDNNCNGSIDEGCSCSPGAKQACSLTPGGQPISFPGGVAKAPCAQGVQTCVVDGNGSAWGPCLDAVGPVSETCTNPGVDNDCDGVVDDDPIDAVSYQCDDDSDGHLPKNPKTQVSCGVPTKGCKNWLVSGPKDDCADDDATRYPGAAETCGDGIDKNCDGQDSDGFGVGDPCNVTPTGGNGDAVKGACLNGGKTICSGTKQTACKPLDETTPGSSKIGKSPTKYWPTTTSPNGSDDWDCDGTPEYSFTSGEPTTVSRTAQSACLTDAQICDSYTGYAACSDLHVVPSQSDAIAACCSCSVFTCPASCYSPVVACGASNLRVVHCQKNAGGKCVKTSTGSATLSCL